MDKLCAIIDQLDIPADMQIECRHCGGVFPFSKDYCENWSMKLDAAWRDIWYCPGDLLPIGVEHISTTKEFTFQMKCPHCSEITAGDFRWTSPGSGVHWNEDNK